MLLRRGSGASVSSVERRGSNASFTSASRRGSVNPHEDGLGAVKHLDVEQLEVAQRQRRSSMQQRRTSLAEVIPDWPQLHKRKAPEKVDFVASVVVVRWIAVLYLCA